MSALIKSGVGSAIRSYASREPLVEMRPPVADPREAECRALRAEIERLNGALRAARADADQTILDAQEKGRRAGIAEAATCEAARLEALQEALNAAVGDFGARLEILDGLAPALVRAALAKLFNDPQQWAVMSEEMLARQLRQLRRSSIIVIRVSGEDFSDKSQVEALAVGEARVEIDNDLRAGVCRIECKLGQIDLDVREQWSTLSQLLDAMGEAA